jgi:hypothetical protein
MYAHPPTTNDLPPINPYETLAMSLWRRAQVLVIGFSVGVVASAMYLRATQGLWDWELLASVAAGAVTATQLGISDVSLLGWMGAMMAIVHPLRPTYVGGMITVVGLATWFLSGFFALQMAYRM